MRLSKIYIYVKRLDFINSEVLSLNGGHLEIQPTSPPLGVIFGFKSDTQNRDIRVLDYAQFTNEQTRDLRSMLPSIMPFQN